MIATTPLEQALIAWGRNSDRQAQFDDAVTLGECGIFSNRNISHITGLNPDTVAKLTGKRDKGGGRLNPESLPMLYDVAIMWRRDGIVLIPDLRRAVALGTSPGMASVLTGISRSTCYHHAKGA